jgi:hypothetical protein
MPMKRYKAEQIVHDGAGHYTFPVRRETGLTRVSREEILKYTSKATTTIFSANSINSSTRKRNEIPKNQARLLWTVIHERVPTKEWIKKSILNNS